MGIAWVFPGQGSQKIGMEEGVLGLALSKERFDMASDLLGWNLFELCTNGRLTIGKESTELNNTRNTQLALFVIESLLVDALRDQGKQPQLLAGHSLGEITALYAANVFNIDTGLKLVKRRSELMAVENGGKMVAVIGFDRKQLEELITVTDRIAIANDNSDSQVVLSGDSEMIQDIHKFLNCKKVIPLNVSGAFHSHFMINAAKDFEHLLDQTIFKDGIVPVLSNAEPTPTCDAALLKQRLKKQMTSRVRWRETMQNLNNMGISITVEIGPGNVLSNLLKRNLDNIINFQVANTCDLGL
uniref:[acyl-carrier-protein] S-malonyltransferase n=1 Tax=Paulinella chromatophora TaxID=39717 RepID=B1X481_PAUCH|nr:Malonyl CoA-acyl carrier protein transacylase [Paulinella chromatophora]ACB42750.1 Malonyl CoA-acyl carrier protein transacylase [Paulinella chromatophora]